MSKTLHSPSGIDSKQGKDVAEANIAIWCDGSCWEGYGGWAAILVAGDLVREVWHGDGPGMTNQRAEMMAVIEGLTTLNGTGHRVRIYSDSAYVVNCFQQDWITNWRRKGWRKKGGEVANRDLWIRMDALVHLHQTTFHKVPGHSGVEYNERADMLAGAARHRVQTEHLLKEQRASRIPTAVRRSKR